MFENYFLPYLFKTYKDHPDLIESLNDPIDSCMSELFQQIKQVTFKSNPLLDRLLARKIDFSSKIQKLAILLTENVHVETIQDFELDPSSRRAKILMQTCAHISGAAYYYDPKKYRTTNEDALKKVHNAKQKAN
jgi:hypothetical protein